MALVARATGSIVAIRERRQSVEEVTHRHVKRVGHLIQGAGTNPIETALVFLDLLEGHADCLTQRSLTHCQSLAALLDPAADEGVNIGPYSAHRLPFQLHTSRVQFLRQGVK
jgi:hypothetical protein